MNESLKTAFLIKTASIMLSLVLIFLMLGCESKEYDEVKKENERLKLEIQDLKFGAETLLSQAKIEYGEKHYAKARNNLQLLTEKHPYSKEAKEAITLLSAINKEIEKEDKERIIAEKKATAQALKNMYAKKDNIKGVTWYRDRSSPRYVNYNGFFLYFGVDDPINNIPSEPYLRFKVQYNADDWLFIQSYTVKADDKIFERSPPFERDSDTDIWEWSDISPSRDDIEMIECVISSKRAVIRFEGNQYHKDINITPGQKQALKNVLAAYKALGGVIPH